ncbi:Pilin [Methylomagnum ishizawai]|uniref:Pilin n=1 Tax=Methylomagnum ishizawai TaxID=1760988 RepID=A0A1Y6D1L8_9GAMM|nr:pilin [Methylomagnum ishizawai]SMF94743.1 Pilin [Methylomagnum ishizawai]
MNFESRKFFAGLGTASEPRRRRSPRSAVPLVLACIGVIAPTTLYAKQTPAQAIQSQVAEGLRLAVTAQAKVAEYFAYRGIAPADRIDAGLSAAPSDTIGKYVTALDISGGVITLTYGNQANAEIVGATLTLTPGRSADGSISWQCGLAPVPPGVMPLPGVGAGSTSVPNEYLPAPCGLSNAPSIPSQVNEGLGLAVAAQASVERYIKSHGTAPQDRSQAGLSPSPTDTVGNYVSGVDISGGVVNIAYGNFAAAPIAGMVLALTPYRSADGSITWQCGLAPAPVGLNPVGSIGNTTLDSQYLPAQCSAAGAAAIPKQVLEGLKLAAPIKLKVQNYIAKVGSAPANRAAIGLTPSAADTSGNYVSSVDVRGGGITITYGNRASSRIVGQSLGLTPWRNNGGDVVWQCGNSVVPTGTTLPNGSVPPITTFNDTYLPPNCQIGGVAPIDKDIQEGLRLARKLQATVEKIYKTQGMLANANSTNLGLPYPSDISGNYVQGIAVAAGALTITYGWGANVNLTARTLGLTPYVSPDGKLTWVCGNANIPTGFFSPIGGGLAATTVANEYLPINCRP